MGVDPGSRTGAYACICNGHVDVFPWDDVFFVQHLHALTSTGDGIICCVEKVGAIHGQGLKSTWNFAKNAGYIEGALVGVGIPFQLVPPLVWKKEFSLNSDKHRSIDVCRRLFPGVNLKRTEKCRTDDSNYAEAILMAEFARRKM